jgi:hypothetical protein
MSRCDKEARLPVKPYALVLMALLLTLVFLGIFFIHPYVLGYTGRVNEHSFERQLRIGMPRNEAEALAERLRGKVRKTQEGAIVRVDFADWVTLCMEGGEEYQLDFSNKQHLARWSSDTWHFAC